MNKLLDYGFGQTEIRQSFEDAVSNIVRYSTSADDFSFRGDIIHLKASFVGAALGKFGPHLISYSVFISKKKIFARIIVDQNITEPEEEDIYDILGNMVGDYNDVNADFELVRVESDYQVLHDELLPIELFRRAS